MSDKFLPTRSLVLVSDTFLIALDTKLNENIIRGVSGK